MLPRSIPCEECGKSAAVRGYGRIEYDWNDGGDDTNPLTIRSVRLTIDCPNCGLQVQDHHPAGSDQHAHSTHPATPRPVTPTFASLLSRLRQPGLSEMPR